MKILNLYCCLGGNRYKWGDQHEITAVELDPELARMYQERFPNDTVIVGDAHEYLLNNYKKFDFIWSSPPCPTHSRVRYSQKNTDRFIPSYPDMKLYQEIILLHNLFEGLFCVENVIPYYKPLIPAQRRGRHLYWANFKLPHVLSTRKADGMIAANDAYEVKMLCDFHEIDLSNYKGKQRKDKIARNLVDYEAGATILNRAIEIHKSRNISQGVLNFAP
jgi:DNA (cytosine-5)-methyltransferase 1